MAEPRGRDASAPRQIPRRGWMDIAARVKDEVRQDNVSLISAGVGFFAFLSLAPALAALVSVYGMVASPDDIARQIDDLPRTIPDEVRQLLTEQLEQIARSSDTGLRLGVIIGVLLAFWSASAAMKHLITAIDVAYDEGEERGPVKVRLLALLLTVAGIVFMSLAIFVLTGLPAVAEDLAGSTGRTTAALARWPVLAAMMLLALSVLYRVAPDRDDPRWRWVTWGAVAATLLWLLASAAFSFYASNFGSYNESYGALAAVVVLMLWLYLTALCVVLGAELNAEIEHQTAQDSTVGPSARLGERRAEMADTVGATREETSDDHELARTDRRAYSQR